MSIFEQFSYSEVSDTLQNRLPDSLRFDKIIRDEGKLLRLLVGSVKVSDNLNGGSFQQRENYSKLTVQTQRISLGVFTYFLSPGYQINHIDEYLRSRHPANLRFYRELLNEFTCYFHNYNQETYTLAFLNLYRILEHISYSFPLVFAGRAKDYKGTYSKLQSFFEGSKSELKFFDHFISDLFDPITLNTRLLINITAANEEIREKYFKVLKRICDETKEITLHRHTDYSELEIDYKSFTHLIISLRNRYFHFLSGIGQHNISSSDIIDPDSFFKCLCKDFANWIAVIYFEIVKTEIEV